LYTFFKIIPEELLRHDLDNNNQGYDNYHNSIEDLSEIGLEDCMSWHLPDGLRHDF